MGDLVRNRLLRALGLANLWVQLDALSTRLARVEQDVVGLQQAGADLARPMTIPASPPPPPDRSKS